MFDIFQIQISILQNAGLWSILIKMSNVLILIKTVLIFFGFKLRWQAIAPVFCTLFCSELSLYLFLGAGEVTGKRSPWRLSFISETFWAIINLVMGFIMTMFSVRSSVLSVLFRFAVLRQDLATCMSVFNQGSGVMELEVHWHSSYTPLRAWGFEIFHSWGSRTNFALIPCYSSS